MFLISKGINISHWLSQFGRAPRTHFIIEQDIAFIAESGFDHIRLPIDEDQMWAVDGTKDADAFADMHACINWCKTYNLKVVVDLHILRSHHFNASNNEGAMTLWDSEEDQNYLMEMWKQLSQELRKYDTSFLAYELMNEPVAPKHGMWNKLVAKGHKTIRELEKDRIIIFGPNMWQMPLFYNNFEIPTGDPNILLSFHTYSPIAFTHYTAPWIPLGGYNGPVIYPGRTVPEENEKAFFEANGDSPHGFSVKKQPIFTKESIVEEIEPALRFAKKHGLNLYCNEFGCLPSVPREMRLQYYNDIIDVFNAHNIAYASWDYKGDFGIRGFNLETQKNTTIDSELIAILTK